MLFWMCHANFRCVEDDIYDPSARIIKNPLNSTIFWTRHLNSATRPKCNYDPNFLSWYHRPNRHLRSGITKSLVDLPNRNITLENG